MVYSPIYCSVAGVQSKTGLSNTEVDLTSDAIVQATIQEAEIEIETITGRKFTSGNSITEYHSIKDKDILDKYQTSIQLNHFPIQSISVLKKLDINNTAIETYDTLSAAEITAGTFDSDDYWLEIQNDPLTNSVSPNGKVTLKTDSFPKGTNNVIVTYTYGYSAVPVAIRDLANCLAGIRCWIRFIGGSYNRLNSYSVPQQNVSKGDFYQRGMQNIQMLTDEANRLLDRIGRKSRVLAFSSGTDR